MEITLKTLIKIRILCLYNQFAKQLPQKGPCACDWDNALELDPTPGKEYLDWVLRMIAQEKLLAEDHCKIPPTLNNFILCRPLLHRDGHSLDINSYETPQDLLLLLRPYEKEARLSTLSELEREEVNESTEGILDSNELLVISPKTEKSSCFWGKGTRWPTAAGHFSNEFSEYTDEYGEGLFIFIDKENPGAKYQLSTDGSLVNTLGLSLIPGDKQANRLFSLVKGIRESIDLAFVRFDRKLMSQLNQNDEFCKKALALCGFALEHISLPTQEMIELAIKSNPLALQFVPNQTKDQCLSAVENEGLALQFVDQSSRMNWTHAEMDHLCKIALENNPYALEFIPTQTDSLCLAQVRINGRLIQCVHKPTPEICLAAVGNEGAALSYIPPELKTAEIYRTAIKNNPFVLKHIENPSEELIFMAIREEPQALMYVKNPTQKMIDLALTKNGLSIGAIQNPTTKDCLNAIRQNPLAIEHIRNPTIEMCLQAVRKQGRVIGQIKVQSTELCLEAVRHDPKALLFIREQTEEICIEAVSHHSEALAYVKNKTLGVLNAASEAHSQSSYPTSHLPSKR